MISLFYDFFLNFPYKISDKSNDQISINPIVIMKVLIIFPLILLIAGISTTVIDLNCHVEKNKEKCVFTDQIAREGEQVTIKAHHINTMDDDVTVVSFRNCSIHTLPSQIFKKFKNLEDFISEKSEMKRIEPKSFINAAQLTNIDIEKNELKHIPRNAFLGAENVHLLKLENNKIQEIQGSSFKGLKRLSFLYLDFNTVKVIHRDAFNDLENLYFLKQCPVMDIRNYPKSFFGNHLTSWPGFDPRDGKFTFLLFYLI